MGWPAGRGAEAALRQRPHRRDHGGERCGGGRGRAAAGRRPLGGAGTELPRVCAGMQPAARRSRTSAVDSVLWLWRRRRQAFAWRQYGAGRPRRCPGRPARLRPLEFFHRPDGDDRRHHLGPERTTAMNDDKPLKSSLELAMERLAKNDADAGIEAKPVTDEQKAAIAEARNFYEAKIAELEVLHQSKVNATFDPAERETLDQQYRRERDHLVTERDNKVARLRKS